MTPHIRILLLVIVAAVGIAACSSATVAADVNGAVITDADVTGIRTAEVGAVIPGEGFRDDLTTLIIAQTTIDAAESDYGITGLDTPEARAAWLTQASAEELGIIESVSTNPGLTDAAVDLVTTQLMVREAVIAAFAEDPEVLSTIWELQQSSLTQVCARHLLVATEAEANDAHARIAAGEDFASVADEVSLDTGSPGGALPCPTSPATYVEPFATVVAEAPIGELTDPFQTEFGWHVVIVESRDGPTTFEEFAADPMRWAPDAAFGNVWNLWRDEAVSSASITVRSQIGRWFPQGDGVLPPPASP
jgi:PPIC-type PPIASE domain